MKRKERAKLVYEILNALFPTQNSPDPQKPLYFAHRRTAFRTLDRQSGQQNCATPFQKSADGKKNAASFTERTRRAHSSLRPL